MGRPLCIYHGGCPDGFTAAWIVHHALRGHVELAAAQYGVEPPDVSDREVIIVDFSYKRPAMDRLCSEANSVLVLDHHQTAAVDLDGLPLRHRNARVMFDMTRSGAMITWDHFHPGEPPTDLVRYVQDRDLWTRALPENDAVFAAITARPYTLDAWDDLNRTPIRALAAEGKAVAMYRERLIEQAIANSFDYVIAGRAIRVANCPYAVGSEVAGRLAEGRPFGAYYLDLPGGVRQWGLRSTGDGEDVAAIAELFGGGGHRHASGFKTERHL